MLMTSHHEGCIDDTYACRRVVIANNVDRVSKGEGPVNMVGSLKLIR